MQNAASAAEVRNSFSDRETSCIYPPKIDNENQNIKNVEAKGIYLFFVGLISKNSKPLGDNIVDIEIRDPLKKPGHLLWSRLDELALFVAK
jgi:hypothetical protein